ncbi:MAG: hypothetical protein H7338_23275 [Candidatus Sericytochromatia bacterium]|nr:hypothetical protein [Candidatus Sericytochromatia bacterium]
MTKTEQNQIPLERFQKIALITGAIGLAVSGLGGFFSSQQFFISYLTSFIFWLGLSLGSLAWLMVHHLTLGTWTTMIKRILEGATRVIPYMLALFIPILFGLGSLYQWAVPEIVKNDPILQKKAWWLSVPFFLVRVVIYFGIWTLLMRGLNKITDEFNTDSHQRGVSIAGPGMLIYFLTVTFAMIDWVMSLYPHWASTMHGVFFIIGNGLSVLVFSILILRWFSDYEPFKSVVETMHFHDLGKLTFGITVFWTYINFGQFLIVWSANLPEEAPWYLTRVTPGWLWFTLALFLFHFALPFAVLLSRNVKRVKGTLAIVAGWMFFMRICDMYWHVHPAFTSSVAFHWLDVATYVGIGGMWLGLFFWQLQKKPLLPPYLPEVHDPHGH